MDEVKGLGDAGFEDLLHSINRKEKLNASQSEREMITINVSVPLEMYSFSLKVPVGGTFQTVAAEDETLGQYLECACGGQAACSTCHVIVDPEFFPLLPPIQPTEQDMLDLAAEVSETSRLGCQLRFSPLMDGLKVTIPTEFNNVLGTSGGTSM